MANTYSQIYIQVIFAVKFRESKISDEMKNEVEKYICGIFNNKKQKVFQKISTLVEKFKGIGGEI